MTIDKRRKWLKDIRKKRQATQLEVAKDIGISRSYYADIESGHRDPGYKVAIDLSEYFGFNPNRFKFDNTMLGE